jgi:hypothetical protein
MARVRQRLADVGTGRHTYGVCFNWCGRRGGGGGGGGVNSGDASGLGPAGIEAVRPVRLNPTHAAAPPPPTPNPPAPTGTRSAAASSRASATPCCTTAPTRRASRAGAPTRAATSSWAPRSSTCPAPRRCLRRRVRRARHARGGSGAWARVWRARGALAPRLGCMGLTAPRPLPPAPCPLPPPPPPQTLWASRATPPSSARCRLRRWRSPGRRRRTSLGSSTSPSRTWWRGGRSWSTGGRLGHWGAGGGLFKPASRTS